MTLTLAQARDEILTKFQAAWLADAASQNLLVVYDDVKKDIDTATSWARVTIRHNTGFQATLSDANNAMRYRNLGLLFVQIFTPLGDGQKLSDQLAGIVKAAFQRGQTPGGCWFRNVRVNEIGPSGAWYQLNVVAEFEYDEVI